MMKWLRHQGSFRARLTLQWTLVFGAILILTLTAVHFGIRRNLIHSLEADLRTIAGTEVAAGTDEQRVHLHPFDEPAIINQHYHEKFVQILTAGGSVVNQSASLGSKVPLISREILREALAGSALMTDVSLNGSPGRSLSVPVTKNGEKFVFVVAIPLNEIDNALRRFDVMLFLVGLTALVATALIGYRLATVALRPVDLMTQRAQLIGRDQLRARLVDPQTDDELGRLASVLNEMLDRLYQVIASHQRFAADASHELRSPLTALRGRMELALRRTRTVDEYRAALGNCLDEVNRLTKLTEDLLELARSDAQRLRLDLSEVELRPVIDGEISLLKAEAEARHITITAEVAPELTVIADENRLRIVVRNLLSNAIHYSKPAGGHVRVSAGNGGADVWVEVRDEGVGLEAEQQQRVFERFWRADGARSIRTGGAGLGLAICQEIARAHGGQIKVTSAPGLGSAFLLCLPARLD
jgi:heavy metal sensor kinase